MRHPHRTRRAASVKTVSALAVALGIGVLAGIAPASPAFAGDPVSLDGRYVVDEAGVLDSSGQAEVQDAIDGLATEQGVNLFVVYTDAFTNPSERQAWATEVAEINQLGTNDVLLAVAVDDRVYQLSVASGFALDDGQLGTVETDYIVPQLRDDDWAGAGVAAAEGIAAELGGGSGGTGGSGSDDSAGGGLGGAVWLIAILIIIVVAALIVAVVLRRRRSIDKKVTAQVEQAGPTQKELDQRVGAVLVDLDDAVTSSDEDLGFAVAQFGAEATAQFSTVLAEVKATLSQAFTLKQKLDDAVADTAEERRDWSLQIIELCDSASDKLDDQVEAFTALRDLERDPAPALAAARQSLGALDGRGTDARTRLTALGTQYDAPALTTVSGTMGQYDQLTAFATAQLAEAETAIAAGDKATAALRIRSAQQAVAQAGTLVGSVATLEADLAAAAGGLTAAIDDAQLDLTEVTALQASQAGQPGTAGQPGSAEIDRMAGALGIELQRARTSGGRDPLNARIALERANAPLDAALATVRGERERVTRLIAQRDRAISSAQAEITAAQSYLQTRRGAVGPDARTRLSEAQRHLEQALALATTDPAASLREATSASQLASLATTSAQQDVSWAQSGGYSGSNSGSSNYGGSNYGGSSGGDDFSGALLGGILGSLLGGGGSGGSSSSRGGWGGGSRGSSWGGGSRSGGSSSRRSSGGSFGGGGRRGGGGRF